MSMKSKPQSTFVLKSSLLALTCALFVGCASTPDDFNDDSMLNPTEAFMSGGLNSDVEQGGNLYPVDEFGAVTENNPIDTVEEFAEVVERSKVIYFGFDQYQLKTKYADILKAHAEFLKASPNKHAIVEGHCDELGSREYNLALGEKRAKVVAQYLEQLGVPRSQMTIVSYGEEKPQALGSTEAAYAENRRAVIEYR